MSLNNTMTSLMNGFRSKYALQGKLSLGDATNLVSGLDMGTIVEGDFGPHNNNSDYAENDGVVRMTCTGDDPNGVTGPYFSYDQKTIIPGKRYAFSVLVRGTMTLSQIGAEGPLMRRVDQKLSPDQWSLLTLSFIARHDLALYCKAKKGDWIEFKDWYFTKLDDTNTQ